MRGIDRVLSRDRRPLGYIDVAGLKGLWEGGKASEVRFVSFFALLEYLSYSSNRMGSTEMDSNVQDDPILDYMTKFKRGEERRVYVDHTYFTTPRSRGFLAG